MKVTISWLKDFTSADYTPAEMAERLTMAGLEVDSVSDRYAYLDNILVARVVQVEQHPDADKLSCCKVDVGGDKLLSIVCGAPNVREGLVVPCAMIGSALPGEILIKKSKLRGQISEGMLCSGAELNLDVSHSGIMELDPSFVPGTPLAEALGFSDHVLEVDLTPNRPDCLSVIGIAREVAAFSNPPAKLELPVSVMPEDNPSVASIHDNIAVDILDSDLCSRYTAGMLVDVKVGPSPFWLQDRLVAVGMTPINNIVDVTNYVMMETGQPLHAFDYDNIAGGRIEVRRAGADTTFKTLDGKDHALEPDMLMICDGQRPVGIAGVMGGENSEILPGTTRVLVESACFNPVSIRRTAKRSGINTDASHRFERGVDPEATMNVLKRAMLLMAEVSKATILNGLVDEHPVKHEPVKIDLAPCALNQRLGTDIGTGDMVTLLEAVGFQVNSSDSAKALDKSDCEEHLTVKVPSFRVDVSRPEDLSEEVARLWGYNRIETRFPDVPVRAKGPSLKIVMREEIRDIMTGMGFSEALNYSFNSASACDFMSLDADDKRRSVETILNPISEELSVMRTTLLPCLFDNMRRNNSQQIDTLKLFEVGKTFLATSKGSQPLENEMLAALWTGERTGISWHTKRSQCDFYDIKGVVESLFRAVGINGVSFEVADSAAYPYYRRGYAATMHYKGKLLGSIGEVNDDVLKNFSLRQAAFVFELDLDMMLSFYSHNTMGTTDPLPKFPSLSRDLTLILDTSVESGSVLADIEAFKQEQPLLEDVFIFDLYEGAPLAKGKKSLSLRVVYRSMEKTLKEKMVKNIHGDISRRIIEKYAAELPS
ncbi:Phenylalanine--tRNA ligase beta subunit [Desulfamplus magnetovallimortis]|uniref:Phenylalanine--tRNA ligase beta subunit n=1 Tax=Desulfamplus magnetovallimortis TaxID=1246637 RepID=A0A1W1H8R7_9BACT|nr:phenylalanine--tRNA ligase subunit beta [Desulfamplus magnetovallimortis]SLM28843.1 Phenylalanine--tRNA ligase beta subunit [Desulfamplus magnetovallimortis]